MKETQETWGSTPGWGRSPGEGNGNPLKHSCLENPMDGGAWQATVHGVQRVRHDWATKQEQEQREERSPRGGSSSLAGVHQARGAAGIIIHRERVWKCLRKERDFAQHDGNVGSRQGVCCLYTHLSAVCIALCSKCWREVQLLGHGKMTTFLKIYLFFNWKIIAL